MFVSIYRFAFFVKRKVLLWLLAQIIENIDEEYEKQNQEFANANMLISV